ncbi:hypothetical protein KJ966_19385 [bacterium]|nr:hypothetical protein [bacterium]
MKTIGAQKINYANNEEMTTAFDPIDYLEENYTGPDQEDKFTAEFMTEANKKLDTAPLVLEFGGGPSLLTVATYAELAREIHFSDFVPNSLNEVQRWLNKDPGAFSWRNRIKRILIAEDKFPTDDLIDVRENDIRSKITKLVVGDATLEKPIGETSVMYDYINAHHCLDVAATNFDEWCQVMKNIASLLKPKGWLVISITTGTTTYTVGDMKFRCCNLSQDDVRDGFKQAGFDLDTMLIDSIKIPAKIGREYNGMTMAMVQKK